MDQLNSTRNTDNGDAISGEIVPPEEDTEETADTAGTTSQAGYPQTYLHKVASSRPGDEPADVEDEAPSHAFAEDRDGAFAEDSLDEREPEPASVAEDPVATTTPDLIPPGAPISAEEQRGRHRAAEEEAAPETAAPEATVPETGAPQAGVPDVAVPEGGMPAAQGRRPGDEPIPPSLEDSLLPDGSGIREEWLRVQAQFVDDPRTAVSEAAGIMADVASRLEAAVRQRQDTLRVRWDGNSQADTEALRVTMQQYRHLLERLVGL